MPQQSNKPNPAWVTAPYEVAGMSDIPGLAHAIDAALALTQGGPLTVQVELESYLPGKVCWKITQVT